MDLAPGFLQVKSEPESGTGQEMAVKPEQQNRGEEDGSDSEGDSDEDDEYEVSPCQVFPPYTAGQC